MIERNDDKLIIRLPANLKAEVMKATKAKRGGVSALVRELLTTWVAGQKKKSSQ
jgi:hypothetical protein